MVYEKADSKCPKSIATGSDLGFVNGDSLPPWAKEVEQLICKEVEKGTTEQKAVQLVCGEITKKIPAVPEAKCETVAKMAYEKGETLCPKDLADPPPWAK